MAAAQNSMIAEHMRSLKLASRDVTTQRLVPTLAAAFDRAATTQTTSHHAALQILRDLEDSGYLILHAAERDVMLALLNFRTRED